MDGQTPVWRQTGDICAAGLFSVDFSVALAGALNVVNGNCELLSPQTLPAGGYKWWVRSRADDAFSDFSAAARFTVKELPNSSSSEELTAALAKARPSG